MISFSQYFLSIGGAEHVLGGRGLRVFFSPIADC